MSDAPKWTPGARLSPQWCAEECDEASALIADLCAALRDAPDVLDTAEIMECPEHLRDRLYGWLRWNLTRNAALDKVKP